LVLIISDHPFSSLLFSSLLFSSLLFSSLLFSSLLFSSHIESMGPGRKVNDFASGRGSYKHKEALLILVPPDFTFLVFAPHSIHYIVVQFLVVLDDPDGS
jgi:hypothetical protein